MTIHGCNIQMLAAGVPEKVLGVVLDGAADDGTLTGTAWLLAHFDDGVVWGAWQNGSWKLSNAVFPEELGPAVCRHESLQEMRVFGEDAEVLVWRRGEAFVGRRVENESVDEPDLSPRREAWILEGRHVRAADEGFSLLASAGGRRQGVPIAIGKNGKPWPARLEVYHHFEQDEATGVVRVALTRLARVYEQE